MQLLDAPPVTPFTLQQVFDRAWQHAVVEKNPPCYKPSFVNDEQTIQCLYRSSDGNNACLIGICIPNSVYTPEFDETGTVMELLEKYPELAKLFDTTIDPGVLQELQLSHDDPLLVQVIREVTGSFEPYYLSEVEDNLRHFANKHKLNIPGSINSSATEDFSI